MRSTTEDVRARVLAAARVEFAEKGLAGARVDRIASSSRVSKERLYAHFGDKLQLFRAVVDLNAAEFFAAVTLDANDPAEFVGSLFDHVRDSPENLRIILWAQLEGVPLGNDGLHAIPDFTDPKLDALDRAQREGLIDASLDLPRTLDLLLSLGLTWGRPLDFRPPPTKHPAAGADSDAVRRKALVDAARRLIAPTHP